MSEDPNFNDCIPIRDLTQYFLGGLDEDRREEIERHLDGCEFCSALSERVGDKIQTEWESELGLHPELQAYPLIEEADLPVADRITTAFGSIATHWKGIVGISKGLLHNAAQTFHDHLMGEYWDFRPASARGPVEPETKLSGPEVLEALVPGGPMVRIQLDESLLTVSVLGYPPSAELPALVLIGGDDSEPLTLPMRVVLEDDDFGNDLTAQVRLPDKAGEFLILLK